MRPDDDSTFTLSDVRMIRYLVFALGGIGLGMLLITDRESPLMVIGFLAVVTIVPIAAIYFLRRRARNKIANDAPPRPGAPPGAE
ncbi:MAG TPA: hypothetical protein VM029_18995 [Opitutaceae bacterium]|nr:hypothetical protein [Opitutaceae bacterium]